MFDRFVVAANPNSLSTFEQALFGPFTIIIQQDIDRKHPLLLVNAGDMFRLMRE